mmetsp:Transcript_19355/g.40043  ORF Transcript_19355/g.40043 Transcript_19355/m.40043 type:complete len:146 (-) Transcript_19355:339-776(-)
METPGGLEEKSFCLEHRSSVARGSEAEVVPGAKPKHSRGAGSPRLFNIGLFRKRQVEGVAFRSEQTHSEQGHAKQPARDDPCYLRVATLEELSEDQSLTYAQELAPGHTEAGQRALTSLAYHDGRLERDGHQGHCREAKASEGQG